MTILQKEMTGLTASPAAISLKKSLFYKLLRTPSVIIGSAILAFIIAIAILAPLLGTIDPAQINPSFRNKLPGTEEIVKSSTGEVTTIKHWLGTDTLGRDIYSRVVYGTRISLVVGISVATISVSIGLLLGMLAGYIRWLDNFIMRFMDGLMAIPAILLAIALVSLWGAGLVTVILAIVVPEIPRTVRLVRAVVLSVRQEPYVEAAVSLGTPLHLILFRHIMPNTIAPLIVQGTFVCASAILVEAILSFLGIGIPTDIPTWGNIMAEGRQLFRIYPHNILFPGISLAITVLAINILGDSLRDTLDPRLDQRV